MGKRKKKVSNLGNLRDLKKIIIFLIVLLGLSFAVIFFLVNGNLEKNRVVNVTDGDSFRIKDGRRVRLLGIDAPERGRCGADAATKRLTELILDKRVRLTDNTKDIYGRTLANVWVDCNNVSQVLSQLTPIKYSPRPTVGYASLLRVPFMVNQFRVNPPTVPPAFSVSPVLWQISKLFCPTGVYVNKVMVEGGLAKFIYVTSPYYSEMKEAGQKAKEQQIGVWSDNCHSSTPKNECVIKGNIREGKKTYHLPGCDNYNQTLIDEAYGDQWFCGEEEAEKAGFGKAEGCE